MIKKFLERLYEKKLLSSIDYNRVPAHVAFVVCESDLLENLGKLRSFIKWCQDLFVKTVSICVSVVDVRFSSKLRPKLAKLIRDLLSDVPANLLVHADKLIEIRNGDKMQIEISLGFSGRKELVYVIKKLMKKVECGELRSNEIDEKSVEKELVFKSEPDLVIRSGGKQLFDFLLWQSIYSELYFTDVNWANFRRIDFLRSIRDYQQRQRRTGL